MKRVLVVDDEPTVRFLLTEALTDKLRGITVAAAADGQEAFAILESKRVDLVLTDLRMPEVNGFELLAYLRRSFPYLPVVLMTAYGPDELARAAPPDDLECFSKPIDVPALKRKISDMLAQRVKGKVENISLSSFLQLLEMERKTCTLGVTSGERQGHLYFRGGRLVGANTAKGLEGRTAALEVVTWDQADIEISEACPPIESPIEGGLQFLLMEGMRLKDERDRGLVATGATEPVKGTAAAEDEASFNDLLSPVLPESLARLGSAGELAGKIRDGLERAREIDGSLGTLLVETEQGAVIGASGASPDVDLEGIAAEVAGFVRSRELLATAEPLDVLEEMTVTSSHRHYLVHTLAVGGFFLLLVLDRSTANLGMARLQLTAIERDLGERLPALAAPARSPETGRRRKGRK